MTYRLAWFRSLILALLSSLGFLAALFVVIAVTTSDRALAAFLLLWVAGVAWTAYWGLFRYAYEVGIAGDGTLRWCSISGCREPPLSAVRGISTPWRLFGAGLRRIDIDGGRSPVLIAGAPGFDDVLAMIVAARPDLVLRTRWYDRLAARLAKTSLRWRRV